MTDSRTQSMIVAKMFAPETILKFSDQACVIRRNGERFLSLPV